MVYLATLHPTPPYDFVLRLQLLARYAHPTLDMVDQGAYWRALRVGAELALVRVTSRGTSANSALEVDLMAQSGAVRHEAVLAALTRVLPLTDASAFYTFAHQDEHLTEIIQPVIGLPEIRTASVFEALAQTIIEQQISWTTAQRAQRWLVEWAGSGISYNDKTFYTFPTAAQIAAASPDDLKPLKITFKRIALLQDIAQRVTNGELALETLCDLPPEAAYTNLLNLKGIGHWTAVVTLARACGYYHGVAHNDVALQSATNRYFYGGQGRIPPALVTETFARYGEFAGFVADLTLARWVLEQYPVRLTSE
ncbi:MAG TPA: hypothetical protein VHO69_15610 [Phototrophicaceae bacterium]|nr:hypothetical protein [Phototrophicaceae bacterium]